MVKGWHASQRKQSQILLSDQQKTEVETVSIASGKPLTFPQIYQANADSCISINTSATATVGYNIFGQQIQSKVASAGSGFVLTADGYLATNCHVVNHASDVNVTLNNGTSFPAEVIGSDADYDIAILKIDPGETKLKPVVIGASANLTVGSDVSTIGNPLGELTFSMTRGIVSCLNRKINLNGTPFNMIQVDTAINPGNSGGPLFNNCGEVVGIVTAKTSAASNGSAAEGLGFAIPIDDVLAMLKDIMENGRVTSHAYMGIRTDDAANYPAADVPNGAYLVEIIAGGPAEKAGLKIGDIITMIGTATITSSGDLHATVGSSKTYQAGDTVTVTYVRNGQVQTSELTFGSTTEMPLEPESKQKNDDGPDQNYGGMDDFFRQFFEGTGI